MAFCVAYFVVASNVMVILLTVSTHIDVVSENLDIDSSITSDNVRN